MRDHLKSFLSYLKLNRHVSPHKVRAYESDVSQYLAWVSSGAGKKISQLAPALDDPADFRKVLSNGEWLESKRSLGGTSLDQVRAQLARARALVA